MDSIARLLESPYTGLLIAVILGAVALSGKFSVTATQILLLVAWAMAVVGLRDQPIPILVGASAVIGGGLLMLSYYFKPEIVPQYFGVLTPKVETILSGKTKTATRTLEIGDSDTKFVFDGPQGKPLFNFFEKANLTLELIDGELLLNLGDDRGQAAAA
jgi:hypothetical protein